MELFVVVMLMLVIFILGYTAGRNSEMKDIESILNRFNAKLDDELRDVISQKLLEVRRDIEDEYNKAKLKRLR